MLQMLEQIPLQPMEQPMVRQAVPCSHGGPQRSRSPPAPCGRPHSRAGGCPKEVVTPWGAPCWSRLLAGLVIPWGTQSGAACSEGLHPAGGTPRWGSS